MLPKKQKLSRAPSARQLERPKKDVRDALKKLRSAAGSAEIVSRTIFSLLTTEEKEALRLECLGGSGSKQEHLAGVGEAVLDVAQGSTEEASHAKRLLAHVGHKVFRKKRVAEKVLRFQFSRHLWAGALSKEYRGRKRGRKSIVKNADVTRKVHDFLMANSLLTSHYRKIKGELVQCRALSRSKSKLWKLNKNMQELMSLTTWWRHLKSEHRQFKKFKKAVDMCPVCHKYDKLVVPRVRKGVEKAFATMEAVDSSFFASLNEHWSSLLRAGKTDPDGRSSLQFVRGAIQYIDKNMQPRRGAPMVGQPGALRREHDLREAGLEALKELKSLLPVLEGCEHHFHSMRRQHRCREGMEEQLEEGVLLLQLDYAENITIPVGPVEEQSWFWATARLGVSTLGIYALWLSGTKKHRVYFHYVSQILDHTALHASVALKDCINSLKLPSSCKIIHVWSDCGPHYRAYMPLWHPQWICYVARHPWKRWHSIFLESIMERAEMTDNLASRKDGLKHGRSVVWSPRLLNSWKPCEKAQSIQCSAILRHVGQSTK